MLFLNWHNVTTAGVLSLFPSTEGSKYQLITCEEKLISKIQEFGRVGDVTRLVVTVCVEKAKAEVRGVGR